MTAPPFGGAIPLGGANADGRRANVRVPAPDFFFDIEGNRRILVVSRLGNYIHRIGHVRLGTDRRLYRYIDGVYRPDGEAFAGVQTRQLLGARFKRAHIGEVVAWLSATYPSISDQLANDRINCQNGIVNWRTMELAPHTPEFLSTVQVPIAFASNATCPKIQKFLTEVLPADSIDFVFEIAGLALYSGNPFRKAVLLLGPGADGKTVLLKLFSALVGSENVSSVPLQKLTDNRFAAADLFGKLANICGDLDAHAVKQSDTFKMLTGGDKLRAERKYGQPFDFIPIALLIFSANEAPMSADQTEAWFDRWLVIPMERRFPEEQQDRKLTSKLTRRPEMEGFLVEAFKGLRRLMRRGKFKIPASIQEARAQYRAKLDTVGSFVEEICALVPDYWIRRATLYESYGTWCKASGRPPVSTQAFHRRLREQFAGTLVEKTRNGRRGWSGIKVQ